MPSRKRPRPVPLFPLPAHLIATVCLCCGYDGAWDPERGIVLHALGSTCTVRPEVADEEVAA